jgi:hypothetical protein
VRGRHFYNGIPLVDSFVQAVSKVHDVIMGIPFYNLQAQFRPSEFGLVNDSVNLFYNFPTMVPAAAYTGAAFTSGTPAVVDLAVDLKRRR